MDSASSQEWQSPYIDLNYSSLPTVGELKLALAQPGVVDQLPAGDARQEKLSHQTYGDRLDSTIAGQNGSDTTSCESGVHAWVTLEPVNDAVHEFSDDGIAVSIVNRETLAYLGFPQRLERQALAAVLVERDEAELVNPALEILKSGGVVRRLS